MALSENWRVSKTGYLVHKDANYAFNKGIFSYDYARINTRADYSHENCIIVPRAQRKFVKGHNLDEIQLESLKPIDVGFNIEQPDYFKLAMISEAYFKTKGYSAYQDISQTYLKDMKLEYVSFLNDEYYVISVHVDATHLQEVLKEVIYGTKLIHRPYKLPRVNPVLSVKLDAGVPPNINYIQKTNSYIDETLKHWYEGKDERIKMYNDKIKTLESKLAIATDPQDVSTIELQIKMQKAHINFENSEDKNLDKLTEENQKLKDDINTEQTKLDDLIKSFSDNQKQDYTNIAEYQPEKLYNKFTQIERYEEFGSQQLGDVKIDIKNNLNKLFILKQNVEHANVIDQKPPVQNHIFKVERHQRGLHGEINMQEMHIDDYENTMSEYSKNIENEQPESINPQEVLDQQQAELQAKEQALKEKQEEIDRLTKLLDEQQQDNENIPPEEDNEENEENDDIAPQDRYRAELKRTLLDAQTKDKLEEGALEMSPLYEHMTKDQKNEVVKYPAVFTPDENEREQQTSQILVCDGFKKCLENEINVPENCVDIDTESEQDKDTQEICEKYFDNGDFNSDSSTQLCGEMINLPYAASYGKVISDSHKKKEKQFNLILKKGENTQDDDIKIQTERKKYLKAQREIINDDGRKENKLEEKVREIFGCGGETVK